METLKKDWKEVRYVGWESSMSPIIEREEKTMQYHVAWDKDNERGWFEVYELPEFKSSVSVDPGSLKCV